MKSKQLNQWLWKWHIIAGLISVPFMIILAATGSIYLFKGYYNDYVYQQARFVDLAAYPSSGATTATYAQQLESAQNAVDGHIMSVTLPTSAAHTTAFRVHKKGHARNVVYVNPYTSEVTGEFHQQETLMHTVRKLHGELLLGLPGTLLVELVASWFVVLAISGLYVWWPIKKFSIRGFFSIRTRQTRRFFWRDMHSVVGFWVSLFMLMMLAGGMPWTEMFGSELKWVQKQTDSGYPRHWRNSKGLQSNINAGATRVSLDQVVAISDAEKLDGAITIKIPMNDEGVYSIQNRAFWLRDQKVLHVDQYTAATIKRLDWSQVGVLMEMRQFFMRLHQGEYGLASLVIVLLVVLTFLVSTIAGLVSYLIRKPPGSWGLPKVPDGFTVGSSLALVIVLLGILFPTFGISLVVIFVFEKLWGLKKRRREYPLNQ